MKGIRTIKAAPALDLSVSSAFIQRFVVHGAYTRPILRSAATTTLVRRLIWTSHKIAIGNNPNTQSQMALTMPCAMAVIGTTAGCMQRPSAPFTCFQKYDGGRHCTTMGTKNPTETTHVMTRMIYIIHLCHFWTASRRRKVAIEVRMHADSGA